MRPAGSALLHNVITRNPYVRTALAACLGQPILAVYYRPLVTVQRLAPPDLRQCGLIVAASLLPLCRGLYAGRDGGRVGGSCADVS